MLRCVALLASVAGIACWAGPAMASGFYLQEQAAKEVGRGFAGGAAAADDASTVFFNPAGMTELPRVQTSINGHWLFVDTRQSDRGSTRSVPGLPNAVPTGGNSGGNPFSQPILVPSVYGTAELVPDRLWIGLGVSSPYGVKVRYSDDFFGRYDSIKSDLKTVDIQPSIALKLGDHFSVGAGLNIELIDVKLRNALPNLSPLQPDGQLNVKGDDLSVGYNVGVLAKFGAWRFGADYRSRVKHRLDGYTTISGLQGPLAGSNGTAFATAPITLPDSATVSVMYGAGKPLRVYATGKWFNWSVFREIRIEPLGATPLVSIQNYRDSWSGALGIEADVSRRLTLRAGSLYDTTPTRDGFRTTRVPDGNRTWATAGATFKVMRNIDFNLSYAHVFVDSEPVNRVDAFYEGTPAAITSTVRSINTGNADEIAASIAIKL